MTAFGDLIAELRRQRGLTQDDLAKLADIDRNSVARVEQGTGGVWRPRTALRVFNALNSPVPLTDPEALAFAAATGLSPRIGGTRLERDIIAEDAGLPVHADAASKEMRDVHRALSRLLEALGPAKTTDLLDSTADALDIAKAPRPTPSPSKTLTVVSPPTVPFPGAVEQVHRTYAVQPAPKKAQAAPKSKARKRTG